MITTYLQQLPVPHTVETKGFRIILQDSDDVRVALVLMKRYPLVLRRNTCDQLKFVLSRSD